MCIVFLSLSPGPGPGADGDGDGDGAVPARYKLVMAANRDEYLARPSLNAAWWGPAASVLSGRDAQPERPANGTWLGISRAGRIGVLTNFRELLPKPTGPLPLGRGRLVSDFLLSGQDASTYVSGLEAQAGEFGGFNLLVGELAGPDPQLEYLSNRGAEPHRRTVPPGFHSVSNASLNSPWPKQEAGLGCLREVLASWEEPAAPTPPTQEWEQASIQRLVDLLSDATKYPDEVLPETGCPVEVERELSSVFVEAEGSQYGTRAQTVLLVGTDNRVTFFERARHSLTDPWQTTWERFQLAPDEPPSPPSTAS